MEEQVNWLERQDNETEEENLQQYLTYLGFLIRIIYQ